MEVMWSSLRMYIDCWPLSYPLGSLILYGQRRIIGVIWKYTESKKVYIFSVLRQLEEILKKSKSNLFKGVSIKHIFFYDFVFPNRGQLKKILYDNIYLSHRFINSFLQIKKWIKAASLVLIGQRPGLTKLVLILWFLF